MVQIHLFVFLSLSPKSLLSISFSAFSNLLPSRTLSLQQHNSVLISHNHSQPSSSPSTTTKFNNDRRVLHHHHRHALHHHHWWRWQRRLMEDEVAEAVAPELSRLED
ncbi:hypothetical protein Bca4012_044217 [Brassica carinata]